MNYSYCVLLDTLICIITLLLISSPPAPHRVRVYHFFKAVYHTHARFTLGIFTRDFSSGERARASCTYKSYSHTLINVYLRSVHLYRRNYKKIRNRRPSNGCPALPARDIRYLRTATCFQRCEYKAPSACVYVVYYDPVL